jgi:hypothetical protein
MQSPCHRATNLLRTNQRDVNVAWQARWSQSCIGMRRCSCKPLFLHVRRQIVRRSRIAHDNLCIREAELKSQAEQDICSAYTACGTREYTYPCIWRPRMASQRVSTLSGDSRDSTTIDPQSPLGSLRKLDDEDQRPRSVYTHSSSSQLPVGSMASLNPQSAPNDAPGWPRLARLMSKTPALSAHPRFSELNARNLLYYEAQLNNLKVQLLWAEHQQGLPTDCYRQIAEDADSHYHRLMLELRALLQKYSKFINQSCDQVPALNICFHQMKPYSSMRGSVNYQIQNRLISAHCVAT